MKSLNTFFLYIRYRSEVWVQYLFSQEINTFIQQGCIKIIKINSKDFCIVKKSLFKVNGVQLLFCAFYFLKNSEKETINFSQKSIINITIFNNDNNKECFLSTKSAY